MRYVLYLLLAVCWLSSATPSLAQTWAVDLHHSTIMFLVDHIFVKVPGTFDEVRGQVRFDPKRPGQALVDVEIPVASVNTRVKQRDDHLRSADFFNAAQYPTMRFASSNFRQIGKGRYEARGRLTIKNVTKDVVVPFTWLGSKPSPMSKDGQLVGGLEGRLKLNRLDYHVGDGSFAEKGLIGREVEIVLYLEMLAQ